MGTTKIENTEIDLTLVCGVPISALCQDFISIEQKLRRLNDLVKMAEYHILRDGELDVWNVTALTRDERQYTTAVSFVGDRPYYVETSLEVAEPGEAKAFFDLIDLIVQLLKTNQIASFDVKWE